MRVRRTVVAAATVILGVSGAGAAAAQPTASEHGVLDSCRNQVVDGHSIDLLCRHLVVSSAPGATTPLVTAAPAGYGPADLAAAFHIPSSGGQQGTVAIIGVGGYKTLEKDLAKYRSTYHLPACTTANGCLTVTSNTGGGPVPIDKNYIDVEQQYATETALDLQLASAACPTCKIRMVEIPFDISELLAVSFGYPAPLAQEFATGVNYAVSHGANAVSMSYGLPNGDQRAQITKGSIAAALNHTGVAILASSGDSGYTGADVTWPTELPTVTSVGGVTTTKSGSNYVKSAWGNVYKGNYVGAGSGCAVGVRPAVGQPSAVSQACNGVRSTSDVSADADPKTGVAVYDTWESDGGGWLVVGGTSASSPWLAGLYARAGVASGVHGPNTMYSAPASAIEDVTTGSNAQNGAAACTGDGYAASLCVAGVGWDGPTGVGVPNGLGAF